ncbi:MAG: radical SAM protein, partial [Methanophagales archaeon]|nr:radical SAM protein [Methanophagales archaeon]
YPLLTSRGCPHHCIYCAVGVIWGRRVRFRSVTNIIEEIKYAQANYNWHHKPFTIQDDCLNANVHRALEFCERIIHDKIDITWSCPGIRADNMPLELAMKMKMAGCVGVSIGVESADPQVLKNIKKGETIEQISDGIKNLIRAGIRVNGGFMIGNPGDNLQTIKKSIEFIRKSSLSTAYFNTALPYPKTELWDFVQKQGHFLNDDYTNFHHFSREPIFETDDFPRAERIKAYMMARRFYLVHRLKSDLRLVVIHLKWRELKENGVRRGIKFMHNFFKIILDILLNREQRV